MEYRTQKDIERTRRTRRRRILPAIMFGLGLLLVAFSTFQLAQGIREDAQAAQEYDALRDLGASIWRPSEIQAGTLPGEAENANELPRPERPEEAMRELLAINSDFIGWIRIPGTAVDYPVVRGGDNVRYLYTTFGGESNPAGTIFMDYRAAQGFHTPTTILYGHNMRNDTMFSSLLRYQDPDFLARYPEINIMTLDGVRYTYRIFRVWETDAWDPVNHLDFSDADAAAAFFAPWVNDASRVLVLSTCIDDISWDVRFLVAAVLVEDGTATA